MDHGRNSAMDHGRTFTTPRSGFLPRGFPVNLPESMAKLLECGRLRDCLKGRLWHRRSCLCTAEGRIVRNKGWSRVDAATHRQEFLCHSTRDDSSSRTLRSWQAGDVRGQIVCQDD